MNLNYIGSSYEDFPHSEAFSEGIVKLTAHQDYPSCRTKVDVVYRQVDGVSLHLQIIVPTKEHETTLRYPLIVYVQGSAWMEQDKASELVQLARFATKGYVVAIVEYRHSGIAKAPSQVIDAKFAMQYMVEHAQEYFVDTDKLIFWGDSSGANTAMLAGITQGNSLFMEAGLKEYPIKAIVDFYGPTDLYDMSNEPSSQNHREASSPEGRVLGDVEVTKESAEILRVARYIEKDKVIAPFIIFHGSKDRLVPFKQCVILYDALKAAGKTVECYQLVGADHGREPFWTDETLDLVDRFIRKQF